MSPSTSHAILAIGDECRDNVDGASQTQRFEAEHTPLCESPGGELHDTPSRQIGHTTIPIGFRSLDARKTCHRPTTIEDQNLLASAHAAQERRKVALGVGYGCGCHVTNIVRFRIPVNTGRD